MSALDYNERDEMTSHRGSERVIVSHGPNGYRVTRVGPRRRATEDKDKAERQQVVQNRKYAILSVAALNSLIQGLWGGAKHGCTVVKLKKMGR